LSLQEEIASQKEKVKFQFMTFERQLELRIECRRVVFLSRKATGSPLMKLYVAISVYFLDRGHFMKMQNN
jgi:hypothetical protein